MYILLVDISCQKVHDPWPFIYYGQEAVHEY